MSNAKVESLSAACSWIRSNPDKDYEAKDVLLELASLCEKVPARGDLTLWLKVAAKLPQGSIPACFYEEATCKWSNRKLSDVKQDGQAFLIRKVQELVAATASTNASTGVNLHDEELKRRQADLAPDENSKRQRTAAPHSHSKAVTLSLRGLNIQWPFSQLLLLGAKPEEVRTYDLGYRQICNRDEEAWIVETKGPPTKAATNAIVGDLQIAPRPSAAQIVGTVSFADSHPYGYIYLCFGTGFLGGPWASIDSQVYCRACHGVI